MGSTYDFAALAASYDEWYATPRGAAYDRLEKEMIRAALRRAGATGGRLLDVGCGTGHFSEFFAALGFEVTGVDISLAMLERARARLPECDFLLADAAARLPFRDASFDAAAAVTVLEFADSPRAVAAEIARCLRPGGIVVVGALHADSPLGAFLRENPTEPYSSARLYTKTELAALLRDAGFDPVRVDDGCRVEEEPGAVVHAALVPPKGTGGDFLVASGIKRR